MNIIVRRLYGGGMVDFEELETKIHNTFGQEVPPALAAASPYDPRRGDFDSEYDNPEWHKNDPHFRELWQHTISNDHISLIVNDSDQAEYLFGRPRRTAPICAKIRESGKQGFLKFFPPPEYKLTFRRCVKPIAARLTEEQTVDINAGMERGADKAMEKLDEIL